MRVRQLEKHVVILVYIYRELCLIVCADVDFHTAVVAVIERIAFADNLCNIGLCIFGVDGNHGEICLAGDAYIVVVQQVNFFPVCQVRQIKRVADASSGMVSSSSSCLVKKSLLFL